MTKFVYLAGPIAGRTEDQAKYWRGQVAKALAHKHDIIGVSPLRCEPVGISGVYDVSYQNDPQFGTLRAIGSKNFADVQMCDMTLAYLPKGAPVSAGTLIEIGWSYALRKPVVLVSDDDYLINHPVVTTCCSWVLNTLEAGTNLVVNILGAYAGGKNV